MKKFLRKCTSVRLLRKRALVVSNALKHYETTWAAAFLRLHAVVLAVVMLTTCVMTTHAAAPNLTSASNWAHESINQAFSHGLIPAQLRANYTQTTTRAEFSALAVALYETAMGREITARAQFNDTHDISVQKMGGLGVVGGVGEQLHLREHVTVLLHHLRRDG